MRVTVDTVTCFGAGQCVATAPDVFDQDDDTGIAIVVDRSPEGARQDAARLAVSVCPARAIAIEA